MFLLIWKVKLIGTKFRLRIQIQCLWIHNTALKSDVVVVVVQRVRRLCSARAAPGPPHPTTSPPALSPATCSPPPMGMSTCTWIQWPAALFFSRQMTLAAVFSVECCINRRTGVSIYILPLGKMGIKPVLYIQVGGGIIYISRGGIVFCMIYTGRKRYLQNPIFIIFIFIVFYYCWYVCNISDTLISVGHPTPRSQPVPFTR